MIGSLSFFLLQSLQQTPDIHSSSSQVAQHVHRKQHPRPLRAQIVGEKWLRRFARKHKLMGKVANLSVLHTGTNYTIITTCCYHRSCFDGMLAFASRMLQSKYAREEKEEQLAQGCRQNFSMTHPRTQNRRAILLGSCHPRLHRRRHLLHPVHLFLSGDSSANNAPAAGLGD